MGNLIAVAGMMVAPPLLLLFFVWIYPHFRLRSVAASAGLGLLILNWGIHACLSTDSLGAGIAIAVGIFEAGMVAIFGLCCAALAKQRNTKLMGLAIALIYPAGLIASVALGNSLSIKSVQERNGGQIAQALIAYRESEGEYPDSLDQLVPLYLPQIEQPGSIWGWIYRKESDDFSLGFVTRVDRDGYAMAVISSDLKWDFQTPWEATFHLPPTPFPDWKPG